jgi:hypothetical protein
VGLEAGLGLEFGGKIGMKTEIEAFSIKLTLDLPQAAEMVSNGLHAVGDGLNAMANDLSELANGVPRFDQAMEATYQHDQVYPGLEATALSQMRSVIELGKPENQETLDFEGQRCSQDDTCQDGKLDPAGCSGDCL